MALREAELALEYDIDNRMTSQYNAEVVGKNVNWNEQIKAIMQGQYYEQRDVRSEEEFERITKGRPVPLRNSKAIRQVWRRNLAEVVKRENYE